MIFHPYFRRFNVNHHVHIQVAAEKARHLAALATARATIVDDSAITDDGSYKPHPLEEDGSYRGEPAQVVVAHSAVGPVAAVVSGR